MSHHKPLKKLVAKALREDLGTGDITSQAVVPSKTKCSVRLVAKQDGVLSGIDVFRETLRAMKERIEDWEAIEDGNSFVDGDVIASFKGKARAVLGAERTALNFIQHLSGVATSTNEFVRAIEGTNAKICDTRKTTPLLRALQKQAVIDGGGSNHRYSLYDGILIKENHIAAAGGIANAVSSAKAATHHLMRIEIEVENLEELDQAVEAGADVVMLDNMSNEDMTEAARRMQGKGVMLEASGNVTLERVRSIAETGVDLISVGAITHSPPAVDISLLITIEE